MKSFLITGGSGFLGHHLCHVISKKNRICALYHSCPGLMKGVSFIPGDIKDFRKMKNLIYDIKPCGVIHTAALANANLCEENPSQSNILNLEATANLAISCKELKIPFIYTSTDMVFDGRANPYDESSTPSPINVYGQHKLAAEQRVLSHEGTVVRLALMFGRGYPGRKTFQDKLVQSLQNKEDVYLFTDEYRSLLGGESAARGILKLLGHKGLFHLGGPESISRYEYGRRLARFLGLGEENLKKMTQKDLVMTAPRTLNLEMNSSLARSYGFNPLTLEEEWEKDFMPNVDNPDPLIE